MANQSFVSVPPNVEDPTVLRRFLSRLVEQVDIAFGNRAGTETAYVQQQQLIDASNDLDKTIQEAQLILQRLIDNAEALNRDVLEEIQASLTSLTNRVNNLDNAAAIKGPLLRFTVDGSNNIEHDLQYNIDTSYSTRLGVGTYEFELDQNTYDGEDVLDNSVFSLMTSTQLLARLVTTGTTGRFQILVESAGVLTDLAPGEDVYLTSVYNIPGSTLPAA